MKKSQIKDKRHEKIVLYTPDAHLGFGWGVWKEMLLELIGSRELIWRLFLRELSARYRQSVFGYIWAVLPAIVATITFTYLRSSGTLPIKDYILKIS